MIVRLAFVAFTALGTLSGGWLLWQARRDRAAARDKDAAVGFVAAGLLRSELLRFVQQACFFGVALNALIVNQASRLTGGQVRGVVLILIAQTLLTLNSLSWMDARRVFNRRYGAATLDLAERLAAMTAERDTLQTRMNAQERRDEG